ncbi:ABC transporter ATP-binding protein [Paraburkholderia sp. LEh10]|uniref:ABC transporter ATP-binding protein n=1 Tax=Paraburkholderia sp. LEh10 TaxID=2821353 RepID=UPI001AEA82E9|nr:ABC transporter ATP-binding protein [Paraburkholderia sp. LEh10]MBP0591249.1 ABC transporter ATP-binding protein [Paraburkholderia sp. LEh10]
MNDRHTVALQHSKSVSLRNVSKVFGDTRVLHNLSLDVKAGEFLVLLGESGCGKTTALRIVAGLESATQGTVHVGERDVTQQLPRDRDVAMVFQSYALYPHKTVFENIAYPLIVRKRPKDEIEAAVRDVAASVHLEDMLLRYPRQLSGGQRQRVALARAIVRRPAAFLMDEPLSNLDAKLRGHMRAELKHMQHELDITTIYVTHDQIEAMTLAHRVALIDKGVLQQLDTPARIYSDPANLFVAGFIGSPPMNFLRGNLANNRFGTEGLALNADIGYQGAATLGVRPEECALVAAGEGIGLGRIYSVELIGDHSLVTLNVGEQQVVVKVSNMFSGEIGAEVGLRVNVERVYFFDQQTGGRIR